MTKVFVESKDEISLSGCESFSYQTRKVALDNETIHHESIPTIVITDYDQKNETNQEESDNKNKSVIARIDTFVIEGNNNSTNNSVNGNPSLGTDKNLPEKAIPRKSALTIT